MRTFVAIELPAECRARLQDVIDTLRVAARGVRWVKGESAHLTLKFIGELPERDLPAAEAALRSAASGSAPFSCRLRGISGFPARGRPRVIHSAAQGADEALVGLAAAVEAALESALAIPREDRPFKPHVTLGRVKDRRACPPVEQIASLVPGADFGEVRVTEIVLIKSDLTPAGAIYTPLARIPLGP